MSKIINFTLVYMIFFSPLFAASKTNLYKTDTSLYKLDKNIYKPESHTYTDPGSIPRGKLDCKTLVTRSFSFGVLTVPSYCNDAVRACIVFDLIKHKSSLPFETKFGQISHQSILADAKKAMEYNVAACQIIVDAYNAGYTNLNALTSYKK